MNIFFFFETAFQTIIDKLTADDLLPKNLDVSRVVFELPREASHGDLATNAAMVLAKQVGSPPRDLAKLFADELKAIDGVTDVKIYTFTPSSHFFNSVLYKGSLSCLSKI